MSDPREDLTPPAGIAHGVSRLPSVIVEAYNVELKDGDGFVGDRANNRAFREMVEQWRELLRKLKSDPLGDTPSSELTKKKLDKVLSSGDSEAAGVVQSAIEQFASELAAVVQRLLKLKSWRNTERIVVGGGLRASRVGELAIGRASVMLKASGQKVDLKPIHHHPDEGGLIGVVHLVPAWMFEGHEAVLAVDIGGSNIRAGVVKLNSKKGGDLSGAAVLEFELWCHAGEPIRPTRDAAVDRIDAMLSKLVKRAEKNDLKLAPFLGLACPGVIAADGHIERGGQNLPGNWESSRFNLPARMRDLLPKIGKHATTVVMHNDAVVQGLSELPRMQDVEHWAVLTIGTGLGNAAFTNVKDTARKPGR
jgi:predicted NBD/HSP70 family sugar kinase